jgi:alanine racemase
MLYNYRPTWAEINLKAVAFNIAQIGAHVGKGTEILAVVKANAYGHGISPVSRVLVESGVKYLGVATVDEALKIRRDGLDVSILLLGAVLDEEARIAVEHDITITMCDEKLLETLCNVARFMGKRPRVHIKIDTGMGRIGVWHENAMQYMRKVWATGLIEVEGVYTHFSSAGRDEVFTRMQLESFKKMIDDMKAEGMEVKYRHSANSIATVDWKDPYMNLVRPGILLYGIYPKESFRKVLKLKPVMCLKTRIVFLKDTPSGRGISYGRTYITQAETKIATIPIGYADGYGRILSNKAEALLKGQYVRVVGIVTMDQTLLDVGNIKDVKVGDEVILIGEQEDAVMPVEKVAKLAKTIPYEIVACITDRVPRVYKN